MIYRQTSGVASENQAGTNSRTIDIEQKSAETRGNSLDGTGEGYAVLQTNLCPDTELSGMLPGSEGF